VSPADLLSAGLELYSCLRETPTHHYDSASGGTTTIVVGGRYHQDGNRLDSPCRTLALPNALTLIVLAFFRGQARDPSVVGIPYIRA
jgi:hypothetical protein